MKLSKSLRYILQKDLKDAEHAFRESKEPIQKAYWQGKYDTLTSLNNMIEFTKEPA